MKLISVTIKNFRCFRQEVKCGVGDITTFVGKNDIGKSTILEALEIFFNNDLVKIDATDVNVYNKSESITIVCEFDDLPEGLTLDAGATTNLRDEFLVSAKGTLIVRKSFDFSKAKVSEEVEILALHPTAEGVANLLELKEKDLQAIAKERKLDVSLKGNPTMRQAIWNSVEDLDLREVAIKVGGARDERKEIWDQIESQLPIYALFQSDRSSRDSDDEVQNPMKHAITTAISEVQKEIDEIQRKVKEKVEDIARKTHEALKTIDERLAKQLTPQFKPPAIGKWSGLFSVSLDTEDGIPLNKRGSGIRRMILVSFFKAEAERNLTVDSRRGIIYAIEEPETSQHPNNQRILIEAFKTLSQGPHCQVLLTTHSPGLASELPAESIRFVKLKDEEHTIESGVDVFGEVVETLGLIPDSRVRVLFCVEGPTDVDAMKCLSKALHVNNNELPDLSTSESVAFIVAGGSTLKHWVNEHYLRNLRLPEVHIYDSDVQTYAEYVTRVNQRGDGSWAALTQKFEIENYLHEDAIKDAFDVQVTVNDHPATVEEQVPRAFAIVYSAMMGLGGVLRDEKAKIKLAEKAFPKMTAERIRQRDPNGEVEGWFQKIQEML
ncbi:MAG: ATP-binding protein [Ignavibacteria bacterium]|nr:ATP-binding protein [Ignavibacteria bacterium]